MAQTSCDGVNNILVFNSGSDSLGTTAGVKYLLDICKYIKTVKNRNTASGSVSTCVKNKCSQEALQGIVGESPSLWHVPFGLR